MQNIAFVMGSYYPETDANVNCVINLVNQLLEEGYSITCICGTSGESRDEFVNGVRVCRIHHLSYDDKLQNTKKSVKRKFLKLFHGIKNVFLLPYFPNMEPKFSLLLERKLEEMDHEIGFDIIVGVFRPFSSIQALIRFKKRNGSLNKKYIGYYLDILKGATRPRGIPKAVYMNLCDTKERKIFPCLDKILMAENGRLFYLGDSRFDNIKYVNFPTMVEKKECILQPSIKKLIFVYAGYTDVKYRNPTQLVEIFAKASIEIPGLELHLYGKSNMVDELENLQKKYSGMFFYHGQVEKNYVDDVLMQADCVVNMGNNISGVVPSKIFELFGMRKPILHVSPSIVDGCIEYVEKYPDHCILLLSEANELSVEKLKKYCTAPFEVIDFKYLKKVYYCATPEAVINEILKV